MTETERKVPDCEDGRWTIRAKEAKEGVGVGGDNRKQLNPAGNPIKRE